MPDRDRRDIIIEDPTLAAGFTQIPNGVLRRPGLSPGAKLAYVMLLSYAWQDGACFPGQLTLARDMGASERFVRNALKELARLELITIKQRGLNRTNLYILHRLGSAPDAGQDPGPARDAGPDRHETADQDRQDVPTTKTQRDKTQQTNGVEPETIDDLPPAPRFGDCTAEEWAAYCDTQAAERERARRLHRAVGSS